jgi:hypothetical protein
MPSPAVGIVAGSSVLGGAMQSRASSKAARAQERAAAAQQQLEREMFERQVELQEPFRQLGLQNLNRLAGLYGEGGAYANAPGMAEIQLDPGYGFRFGEGMKALERSAAARGGLLSGSMLKGAQRYGQEMGSQEFQNAYARAMDQRARVTNALGGLGGIGPTAASTIGGAAQNYAQGAGQAIQMGGQARASGYIGRANALSNALSQGAMGYGMYRGGYFGNPGAGLSMESLNQILPGVTVTGRR